MELKRWTSEIPLNSLSLTIEPSLHFQITSSLQNHVPEDKHIPLVWDAPSPGKMYESSSFVISYKQMQRPTLYTTCSKKAIKKQYVKQPTRLNQVKHEIYTLHTPFQNKATEGWLFWYAPFNSPSPNHIALQGNPKPTQVLSEQCFHWHCKKHGYKQKPLGKLSAVRELDSCWDSKQLPTDIIHQPYSLSKS